MSIVYCHKCRKKVDTDLNAEHFNEDEECVKWLWDNQEITVNKSEYIELKKSHERLKEAMPDVIILANLGYTPLADKKTMLECIKEDVRVLEIARSALKLAP